MPSEQAIGFADKNTLQPARIWKCSFPNELRFRRILCATRGQAKTGIPFTHRYPRRAELLPFIQMICAKAAYAKGRKLIDDKFKNLIDALIKQITTPTRLKTAKLFFEAFLGYMKYLETMK